MQISSEHLLHFIRNKFPIHSEAKVISFERKKISFESNGSRIRMFFEALQDWIYKALYFCTQKVYTLEMESIYSWGTKVYTFRIRKYILLTCESIYFLKSDSLFIQRSLFVSKSYSNESADNPHKVCRQSVI
jgi:hypothetical protein